MSNFSGLWFLAWLPAKHLQTFNFALDLYNSADILQPFEAISVIVPTRKRFANFDLTDISDLTQYDKAALEVVAYLPFECGIF
jgi:hypothetical protein